MEPASCRGWHVSQFLFAESEADATDAILILGVLQVERGERNTYMIVTASARVFASGEEARTLFDTIEADARACPDGYASVQYSTAPGDGEVLRVSSPVSASTVSIDRAPGPHGSVVLTGRSVDVKGFYGDTYSTATTVWSYVLVGNVVVSLNTFDGYQAVPADAKEFDAIIEQLTAAVDAAAETA